MPRLSKMSEEYLSAFSWPNFRVWRCQADCPLVSDGTEELADLGLGDRNKGYAP